MKKIFTYLIAVFCFLGFSTQVKASGKGFVTVDPKTAQFVVDGKPFYFLGTNLYWLMQKGAENGTHWSGITQSLDAAQKLHFRVIRSWAFADGDSWASLSDNAILQPSPGVYNEVAFRALDSAIYEASKRNIRIILNLVNFWDDFGGIAQYVKWAGISPNAQGQVDKGQFYTNAKAKELYKKHVSAILNRKNTLTGLYYKNDPTIFAWELINEGRNGSSSPEVKTSDDSGEVLFKWYSEMSIYIKSIDKNHLVGTGEEGFDTHSNAYSQGYSNSYVYQPGEGTSYTLNLSIPTIDYGSAHYYPDNWGMSQLETDTELYIKDHTALAKEHGKPFALLEFGENSHSIYGSWLNSINQLGAGGALVWELVSKATNFSGGLEVLYPDEEATINTFSYYTEEINKKY